LQRALLEDNNGGKLAFAALDRAQSFFDGHNRSLGERIEALKIYRLKARFEEGRGDYAAARIDLQRGAHEVERQRLEFVSMEDRADFLAQGRGLFLDLVRLDLDRFHDPLAALGSFERGSNRVLEDSAKERSGGAGESLLEDRLRSILPSDTLVVRFGHLSDRLLIWTFLNGRMEFEQRDLPEAELTRRVERCLYALEHGTPHSEPEAICNLLARNILPRRLGDLSDGGSVMFIPDEMLARLPLASLRKATNESYLVERFRLSYAPSLTILLLASPRTDNIQAFTSPHLHSVLFVSDPAFRSDLFPSLPRLPGARRAAKIYAAHYESPIFLGDHQATIPAVLAALTHVDALQFDGHGLTNSQYPERGGLLLASDPKALDSSSILRAADLPSQMPRRLRLVILGACSTGLTTYRDTAEMTGLAATFLARGVPEVVASAWYVQDDAAATLLDQFHQGLAAGQPADAALRSAQLWLMHSRSPAMAGQSTWAAFQVFRGAKSLGSSVYSQWH
jgi:hypothetical protein